MGESAKTETAITVTGLKPSHFYNVRVIAVGINNFQSGSKVIRLQTYDRYGRPNLPNGRLPSSFVPEDTQAGAVTDENDTIPGIRSHVHTIESAAMAEAAPPLTREHSGGHLGQRRNTVGRKHSGSTASSDHPPAIAQSETQESMQQLTEKFESIREEIEEVNSQTIREAEEFNTAITELEREKTRLRQILKEKEEASEKLKKEVNYAERSNRQAQNRRAQVEKELKDKQAERAKKREDIAKWKKDMDAMKREREVWAKETKDMRAMHDKKMTQLRAVLKKEQDLISQLEEEIRIIGRQIKDLEAERQKLPGIQDDDESKVQNELDRQRDLEWERKERGLIASLNEQSLAMQHIAGETQKVEHAFNHVLTRQPGSATGLLLPTGNTSMDFEHSGKQKGRQRRSRNRKSRNGTVSSPSGFYSSNDQSYMGSNMYGETTGMEAPYAVNPYFDLNGHSSGLAPISTPSGMSLSELRAMSAGAPLSPNTASSLLPSNFFEEDDDPVDSEENPASPFGTPFLFTRHENDPQSPLSDGSRSASLVSSPHNSTLNLNRFSGNLDSDRRSNSMNSSGTDYLVRSDTNSGANVAPPRRFDFLNSLRARGKTSAEEGVPLGNLKSGQSHSFPRQTDEDGPPGLRTRRTSFTTGWPNLVFRNRSSAAGEVNEGNGPAPARNAGTARRRRGIFGSALDRDEPRSVFDRDPSSPRPASIASSDLPRPSTESARMIWGQTATEGTALSGWGPVMESSTRNSPLAMNWPSVVQPWSRTPSRRPSIQNTSNPALNLTSGIVSDDDEFLPVPQHQSSPPPAGVIGGPRPKSGHKLAPPPITPKLNPAAPTFKTKSLFSRSAKPEKDKGKAKSKDKDKEAESFATEIPHDISPTTSRKSRDARSIRTLDSRTESHDSFAGGLEREASNTTSEMNPGSSTKDKGENSFQKLLRKGSSSKFSLSGKGTFWGTGSKKAGSNSGAGSDRDRNVSVDRIHDPDDLDTSAFLSRSFESTGGKDSVTSSPSIGGGGFGSSSGGGQRRSINIGSWGNRMLNMGKKEAGGENESPGRFSTEEVDDDSAAGV